MSPPPTDAGAEPVEEVEEDGTPIRVVTRAEMRAGRLRHRAVFIAVVDGAGRLLVHQRSGHKDLWPSYWDVACGGVAAPGESWELAAARELGEELGVVGVPLRALGGGVYDDGDVSVVGRCFVARTDGPFTFADGEVVDSRFVDRSGLAEFLADEPVCPDSVALILPLVSPLLG